MKQQCALWSVWLTWFVVPVIAVLVSLQRGWIAGLVVALFGVGFQVLYVRWFPRFSKALGYGSVDDVAAVLQSARPRPERVILYTASACPFCHLVRKRLADLQPSLKFDLEEIDVTFRPDIVASKKLRTVPVIEADGRFWLGNATSAELANFLAVAGSAAAGAGPRP